MLNTTTKKEIFSSALMVVVFVKLFIFYIILFGFVTKEETC